MNTLNLLSQGAIRQLYTFNRCQIKQPIVQIIDYQQSEVNQKEIILRISDGLTFIDCTLSGNYQINNGVIAQIKNSASIVSFKRMSVIKLIDYFSKIDQTKICKLKIIVRKMHEIMAYNQQLGAPQQIQQYMINNKKTSFKNHTQSNQFSNKKNNLKPYQCFSNGQQIIPIKIQCEPQLEKNNFVNYSKSIPNINQINQNSIFTQNSNSFQQFTTQNMSSQVQKSTKKQQFTNQVNKTSDSQKQPLTLNEILSGKQGYMIGRLVRFKKTKKQTKDGPMTVCYLGMVNKYNQLVRIHLAGRIAMNNEKSLKQNKCYYIKGFDIVNIKHSGNQIRLRQKQYKILQIHSEQIIKSLGTSYYHWDHQSQLQNQYVDVIGMVEDIQQKANYNQNNQQNNLQTKSVIRVVVKNQFKSVRISFWTNQIKILEGFNLKKKEFIIIEDVRKKQSKYYDFGFQSNLIHINDYPFLKEQYSHIFPDPMEDTNPQNINQLKILYAEDPNDNKLRNITAYLLQCSDKKFIYRFCDDCKKKVQKNTIQCHQCGSQHLIFKYNCPLQFADHTGSITVILFDLIAQKLIGKTANQVSQLDQNQTDKVFQPFLFKKYNLTIQNRNQRLIMRSIQCTNQVIEQEEAKSNLMKINQQMERNNNLMSIQANIY